MAFVSSRTFDPRKRARYRGITFDRLVKYSPKWKYSRLMHFPFRGSHFQPQMNSVVISIDGGCHFNNRSDSRSKAAFGVFCGPDSPHNVYGKLDRNLPQTSSRAELEALNQALAIIERMHHAGDFLGLYHEIIIKTDSTYVANIIQEWIWKWVATGGRKADGQPAEHWGFILAMHHKICFLEEHFNMSVKLWRVGREWNTEADALVNLALGVKERKKSDFSCED